MIKRVKLPDTDGCTTEEEKDLKHPDRIKTSRNDPDLPEDVAAAQFEAWVASGGTSKDFDKYHL